MSISINKIVEAPAPRSSFDDALLTWNGDILRLILSNGQSYAGIVEISGDLLTAYVTGDWKYNLVTREPKLHDEGRQVAVRVASIVAVEFIRDQSSPEVY